MTNNRRRHIEGFPGCTITRDRRVFSAFGRELKITDKRGVKYVVLGTLKSGNRTMVQLDRIWQRAFEPGTIKTKAAPIKKERDEMEHAAADLAAEGDPTINRMMENLRYDIKGRPDKTPFSLTMAAVLLGAIGQHLAGTRRGRFERMMR